MNRIVEADSFGQVARDPSLADKVVTAMTEAIVAGRLRAGQRLSSERELADQFGVSRTVIREAVRSLAAQGLVETLSGRGVTVSAIDGDAVSRSMSLFLRSNAAISYEQIHEVRAGLETQITGLAAQRAAQDDLSRLTELNDEIARSTVKDGRAPAIDVEFHRAIAAASHNPLFVVMLDSIGDVLLEVRRAAFTTAEMIAYAQQAHGLILERITARDVDGAREAMATHLTEAKQAWATSKDKRS